MKEQYDGAEPAGNSVAALNLLRLAQMMDRPEWETIGRRTIEAFAPWLSKQPSIMPRMMAAVDFASTPPHQVVIVGRLDDEKRNALKREVLARYRPHWVILYAGLARDPGPIAARASALPLLDGQSAAYVCENFACRMPTSDPDELARQLD